MMSDTLREMIMNSASTAVLRRASVKAGMRTLRQSGLLALFDGSTTLDEIVKEPVIEE